MASALTLLHRRAGERWLIGGDSQKFWATIAQATKELQPWRSGLVLSRPATVLLADRDPIQFLARFLAAHASGCHVFLANPDWATNEWQQVFHLVQPDLIWAQGAIQHQMPVETRAALSFALPESVESSELLESPEPLIMIPTGGTSGTLRFTLHTWKTLAAAVSGFQQYFEVESINSCCVLPLHHVSGLMQCLRSFSTGGTLALLPFKTFAAEAYPDLSPANFFLSLVPTQLQRLSSSLSGKWLAQFQTIFLGGAPAWDELLQYARQHELRLAPTYGMTETAAQIATLKPEDFLSGCTGCGAVLPHAQVAVWDELGKPLGTNQVGTIAIRAASLAMGYYPDRWQSSWFQPGDLGYFDAQERLHLIGRSNDTIITGGENVFPAEVEAAIRATGNVKDVCVVGISDRHWGQVVIAVYVPTPQFALESVRSALATRLSNYKHPKRWIAVPQLPRNAQGKLDRQQTVALASHGLDKSSV